MEHRFGGIVDATLVHEGVVTDDESRWKVIEAIARDLTEAAKKLARNADGDYSPDTYVNRFPPPTDLRASVKAGRKTLTGLADAWHTASLARDVRPSRCKTMEGGRASRSGVAWPRRSEPRYTRDGAGLGR